MKPCEAPVAKPAMAMPSITRCGSDSIRMRLTNAPGSPSSALQTRYLSGPGAPSRNFHLRPAGKPPPPRPPTPAASTRSQIAIGSISSARSRPA